MSKRIFLAVVLALTLGGQRLARADAPAEDAEQQVADAITALRASEHVAPIVRDPDLDEAALIHAEDMAAHHFVGHDSPRSGDPSARVRAVGAHVRRVGENVARAASAHAAIESFEASAPHHAQIVARDYTSFGVAVVDSDEGVYVVEVFAVGDAAEMPPPAVAEVGPEDQGAGVANTSTSTTTNTTTTTTTNATTSASANTTTSTDTSAAAAAETGSASDPGSASAPASASASASAPASASASASASDPGSVPADGSAAVAAASPVAPDPTAAAGSTPSPVAPDASAAYATASAPSDAQGQAQDGYGGYPAYPYASNVQQPNAQSYAATSTSTAGAPTVQLQSVPPSGVQGYWVQAGGRWWYYPIPANARPGQVLVPSSSVTGGPNVGPQASQPTTYAPYPQPYVQAPYGGRPRFFFPMRGRY